MRDRILELITILNKASEAYYNGEEIMPNYQYDKLYDELVELEDKTGIILPDSPTQNVGAGVVDELPKASHKYPALSLAKTKDIDDYCKSFEKYIFSDEHRFGMEELDDYVVLSWKLDGSTVVCNYEPSADGKTSRLVSLVTRGNGEIGSVITHNASYINGIPIVINDFCGSLIVRGEALMSYHEFNKINEKLPVEEQYKNPRNLANATISLLDSREMRKRSIFFKAFEVVEMIDAHGKNLLPDTIQEQLQLADSYGFDTVERRCVRVRFLRDYIEEFTKKAETYEFPVDGLVTFMNDAKFTRTLKGTAHNPHIMCGYALKWEDEVAQTILRDIEWSASRTGLLNPVAVFDPVELEGTTVTRASLHNLSYILNMNLSIGDEIGIIKANKIIPQVVENYSKDAHETVGTEHFDGMECPVCGEKISIEATAGDTNSLVVMCRNPECTAKHVGRLVHFCERDCMNILGMSEMTISKLVSLGIIREYSDFFKLGEHPEIADIEGFGEKSWKNMVSSALKASTDVMFVNFIHSLGIPNIGHGQAKLLKKYLLEEYRKTHDIYREGAEEGKETLIKALARLVSERFDFTEIEGFGAVLNKSIYDYFDASVESRAEDILYGTSHTELGRLLDEITFADEWDSGISNNMSSISGKTFVITGSLNHFDNRDELKAKIEELDGKCTGSVTKNTDYLINNDVTSTSGKNKKAKELNVPIISEDAFLDMIS